MDYYEIITKLIGPTMPVGESHTDPLRMERLKELTGLIDDLLQDVSVIARYSDRPEASMRKAGEYAKSYLTGLREW